MSFFRLLLDAMLLLGSPIIPLLVHQHHQLHPLDNQQALDTLCLCTPPEQMVLYAYTDMPPCCDLTLELKHTHEKSYYVFQYKPIVQINTKTDLTLAKCSLKCMLNLNTNNKLNLIIITIVMHTVCRSNFASSDKFAAL